MPCPAAECEAAKRLNELVDEDIARRILDDDADAAEVFARSWDRITAVLFGREKPHD